MKREDEKRKCGQSTYPLDWVDNGWTVGSWTMPLDASLGSAAVVPCHITSNVIPNVRQPREIAFCFDSTRLLSLFSL